MYYIRVFSCELEHEGDQEREQALAGHFGFQAKDVTRTSIPSNSPDT